MSAATALRRRGVAPQVELRDGAGEEPTLEQLVSGVWEGLIARAGGRCPICGGPLTPEYGTHPRPVAGRCADCGTTLS